VFNSLLHAQDFCDCEEWGELQWQDEGVIVCANCALQLSPAAYLIAEQVFLSLSLSLSFSLFLSLFMKKETIYLCRNRSPNNAATSPRPVHHHHHHHHLTPIIITLPPSPYHHHHLTIIIIIGRLCKKKMFCS
jgi:hypothetical protein